MPTIAPVLRVTLWPPAVMVVPEDDAVLVGVAVEVPLVAPGELRETVDAAVALAPGELVVLADALDTPVAETTELDGTAVPPIWLTYYTRC